MASLCENVLVPVHCTTVDDSSGEAVLTCKQHGTAFGLCGTGQVLVLDNCFRNDERKIFDPEAHANQSTGAVTNLALVLATAVGSVLNHFHDSSSRPIFSTLPTSKLPFWSHGIFPLCSHLDTTSRHPMRSSSFNIGSTTAHIPAFTFGITSTDNCCINQRTPGTLFFASAFLSHAVSSTSSGMPSCRSLPW